MPGIWSSGCSFRVPFTIRGESFLNSFTGCGWTESFGSDRVELIQSHWSSGSIWTNSHDSRSHWSRRLMVTWWLVAPWTPAEGEELPELRPRSCVLFLSEVQHDLNFSFCSPSSSNSDLYNRTTPGKPQGPERDKVRGLLLFFLMDDQRIFSFLLPKTEIKKHFFILNKSENEIFSCCVWTNTQQRRSRKASWEEHE